MPVIFKTHSTMLVISIKYSTVGVISRSLKDYQDQEHMLRSNRSFEIVHSLLWKCWRVAFESSCYTS
jgi:hypothetical protein